MATLRGSADATAVPEQPQPLARNGNRHPRAGLRALARADAQAHLARRGSQRDDIRCTLIGDPLDPADEIATAGHEGGFPGVAHDGLERLTPREREIVTFTLKGYSSEATGQILEISTGTVRIHRRNIYTKLGISSQRELFARFLAGMAPGEIT